MRIDLFYNNWKPKQRAGQDYFSLNAYVTSDLLVPWWNESLRSCAVLLIIIVVIPKSCYALQNVENKSTCYDVTWNYVYACILYYITKYESNLHDE